MSEPWIKVYAADMRGDPKVAMLTAAERYMLVQAWDLAKNSPTVGELRASNSDPLPPSAFARITGVGHKDATRFYQHAEAYGLATQSHDGALSFPALERRQGPSDATNAVRQRRYRDRHRNAPVTDEVTRYRDDDITRRRQTTDAEEELGRLSPSPDSTGANGTDPYEIKSENLNPSIRSAIRQLAPHLTDADAGTIGRLVNLAKAGAPESAYHDARQALAAMNPRPESPSRYACHIVEQSVHQP